MGVVALWALLAGPGALAEPPRSLVTVGAKTHPWGLGGSALALWDAGPVEVGPYGGVYFYWYEASFMAQEVVLGGFLVLTGQGGVEPGWFFSADDPDAGRRFAVHPLGRGRIELNMRDDHFWLYSRSTGLYRRRSFAEHDPYRGADFGLDEWSVEQSVALMGCLARQGERRWWLYFEGTLEAAVGVGWLDRMPRAGVLVEQLAPRISVDLDLYWSLMDTAVGGPGALFGLWWAPTG